MPAAPKSPRATTAKKPNPLAKPKGAVRAKSGCYTCRIRRKKCDERRVGEDSCETCIRLKLECLGFGAKRPDWLRDTHRVAEIRDRIKAHLAAQGMIKGHAGSGSRNPVQEDILQLSNYREGPEPHPSYHSGTSSSGSPGRDESPESDRPYPVHRHTALTLHPQMSSVRNNYSHPYGYPEQADILSSRCDSPIEPPAHPYEWENPSQPEMYMDNYSSHETPSTRSNLSILYHAPFTIDPEPPEMPYDPVFNPIIIMNPPQIVPFHIINRSVRQYVNNVVKIQYLLGDKATLPDMIWSAVNTHSASQEAVSLLSQLYYARQDNHGFSVLQDDFKQRITDLKTMLVSAGGSFSADDAMAALHVVSLYLFDGGRGRWNEFLSLACKYTMAVLENPKFFSNYPAALTDASPKDEFVVKTTIWFDVLASITTQKPPVLLKYIRELFKPRGGWAPSPSYSMMSPMGCDNTVVYALAETSYLSYWKARHERAGDLSVRELVRRIEEIEPLLQPGPLPIRPQNSAEDWSRYLASEIFRTSTKLFLKTVESGAFPHVQEIKVCVMDVLKAIHDFPQGSDELTSAIVRSTVFGIFIAGSLTDNEDHLRILENHLMQNSGHEGVGNCVTISGLLRMLWDQRIMEPKSRPVRWRDILTHSEILLV